jgi:O-antigen/teichoic acid export membrane protein
MMVMRMLVAHLKTLARHAAIYGSADVFTNVINFILVPIITRHLSPSDYGALGILLLFGAMSKILFRMGLDSAFFRIYYDQGTEHDRRLFTTTTLAATGTLSFSLFAVSALLAEPIGRILLGPGQGTLVILVAADTLLTGFTFLPMNLFRIQGRAGYFTVASVLRNALNLGLKVALVVSGWGVAGVLWSDVLSSVVFAVALAPMLLGHLGRGFSWGMLRKAASFGLPKVPHGLAYQALNLADRKLLDLLSTRAEVGLYHVAYMFGTGVKFFLSAFELAWVPFAYSLLKRADAPTILARIVTQAAGVLVAVGLLIAVLAREILTLMTDPTYHAAYPVVPVVVLAYVIQGFFSMTGIGIGISKRAYYYPILSFAGAATNIGLNLLVIPRFGKMGAAWATVAGYAVLTGLGYYFGNRHYPIPFEWGRIGRIVLAAVVCFGISTLAGDSLQAGLPIKLLALGLFPLMLYALGYFRASEIQALRRLVARPGREP